MNAVLDRLLALSRIPDCALTEPTARAVAPVVERLAAEVAGGVGNLLIFGDIDNTDSAHVEWDHGAATIGCSPDPRTFLVSGYVSVASDLGDIDEPRLMTADEVVVWARTGLA